MFTDKLSGLCGKNSFQRYLFGALVALELLMSFTFLGYIHIEPISITIAYIPVILAACLLGTRQAVFIGTLFGLGSLYKASAAYVLPADQIFSPFRSGEPLSSVILSVGTRAAFALIIGLLFAAAAKAAHVREMPYIGIHEYSPADGTENSRRAAAAGSVTEGSADRVYAKNKRLFCALTAVIALVSPKIHAFLVFSAMGAFFPEFGYSSSTTFAISLNDVMLALLCVISTEVAWLIYDSETVRDFAFCVDMANESPYMKRKMNWFFMAFETFIVIFSFFAVTYFSQRTSYMLEQYDIHVLNDLRSDILMLHIQFLIAMLALSIISLLLVICIYRYMSYREYRGDLDSLTGVMGRRMFMYHCERVQSDHAASAPEKGWFLFIDVDHFKSINDTLGHLTGDMVLREVAQRLYRIFSSVGAVGRVGGDEFAVMIEVSAGREDIKEATDHFLKDISGILAETPGGVEVSCSIGAYSFIYPQTMKTLMSETDELLYKAKAAGRACCVIGSEEAAE